MSPDTTRLAGGVRIILVTLLGSAVFSSQAAAHTGSLRLSDAPVTVPFWLVLFTGGGVVGASFLLASLVTNEDDIEAINDRRFHLPSVGGFKPLVVSLTRLLSLAVLLAVVLTGLLAPQTASNAAILIVWVGWWAGYTMSVYLVGSTWSFLNPWRTLVDLIPRSWLSKSGTRSLPEWIGPWPAVAGLLGLIWIEVVSPVSTIPRVLALVVLSYSGATIAGAVVFGIETWFDRVDPISRVFRCYGRVAPFQRTPDGLEVRLPGTAVVRRPASDETIFIVALLWATTYDGLLSTAPMASVIRVIVGFGVPALIVYLILLVGGFATFVGIFRLASRLTRTTGDSYLAVDYLASRFAPALLPIAAGYHLAHFFGYFLRLSPTLATAVSNPFGPTGSLEVLVLPPWIGGLGLLFVLVGHLLAIWVSHATAFELFSGRLQAIRSQYPFIVVMIFYTMTSMWIITQPTEPPPFV